MKTFANWGPFLSKDFNLCQVDISHPALWREWKGPGRRDTKFCEHLIFVRHCCELFTYINCDQKLGSLLWPLTETEMIRTESEGGVRGVEWDRIWSRSRGANLGTTRRHSGLMGHENVRWGVTGVWNPEEMEQMSWIWIVCFGVSVIRWMKKQKRWGRCVCVPLYWCFQLYRRFRGERSAVGG